MFPLSNLKHPFQRHFGPAFYAWLHLDAVDCAAFDQVFERPRARCCGVMWNMVVQRQPVSSRVNCEL
jgi:hypothetical protein